MSFLLPQERVGTLERIQPLDLHGDRYADLAVRFDGESAAQVGRVHATECPPGLMAGERVSVRFVMGVMVGVARA